MMPEWWLTPTGQVAQNHPDYSGGCEMAAMESTTSHWKPLFNILASSDLNAIVVNGRLFPTGRQMYKDTEWVANLLQHG